MHGVLEEDSDFTQLDEEHVREEDPPEFIFLGLLKFLGSTGTHAPPDQVHGRPEASCFLAFPGMMSSSQEMTFLHLTDHKGRFCVSRNKCGPGLMLLHHGSLDC